MCCLTLIKIPVSCNSSSTVNLSPTMKHEQITSNNFEKHPEEMQFTWEEDDFNTVYGLRLTGPKDDGRNLSSVTLVILLQELMLLCRRVPLLR